MLESASSWTRTSFGSNYDSYIRGDMVWTDGTNIYCSWMKNSTDHYHFVYTSWLQAWTYKTWYGLTGFNGDNVWTDGTDIYSSVGTKHYVLDKATSTWSTKTWQGLSSFDGNKIWHDGDHVYYSSGTDQYELT